ncbi:succinylglutamate desuccinylase/aspartoacylase family protein [Flavobacterium capsici]|uniref:Succinylglutamate desuccinylase/aspartoacylase family protein n=1 Tax=Flavobacterium capsici TaxID=3075618 RepID=A0AA96EZB1_9FLAO|nr:MULTISPECIES: succinylglutamate desuccinylase/aspartoacylase family protein [unclassified Flavobacterium]WNM19513.1 succinylglutamate desuccinylase/aspartoacylase family protein [Flavobacterium sp. PMR2A8]WNM20902.1 succinylglutamate desuccinylase/aspartoacylase family protein [Flavobacterium sp. PMTSA4]
MKKQSQKELIILKETILPGESKTINMEIAKLQTMTKLKIPIIVERSKKPGPTVLFSAGLHGDEINGVEIVRQLITQKINKPVIGTIICIPVLNVFGFVNQSRQFPDGRDLNRVFPGSKTGSLASRFAYYILKEVIPHVDYIVDFHAGGASRFNAPQIRIVPNDTELKALSEVFNAPFGLYSKNISGSFRNSCTKLGKKILLFEGGKSAHIDLHITKEGIEGSKRFLEHLNMLSSKHKAIQPLKNTIYIKKSSWIRANSSGMFHVEVKINSFVEKGQLLATISDPYGKVEHKVKAPNSGYIINVNDASIVYQGDAIFHISNTLEND